MPRFHRPPSGRRQPRTTAKAIALGMTLAGKVARGEQRAVLMPVRLPLENREGYRKRFAADRQLAIHAFWGGPRVCNVRVSDAQRIQLGQVDYGLVRELGYVRLDQFQESWVREHDPKPAYEIMDLLERFQRRHAHREVWVIRFAVDRAQAPRLLAARSDELYVENPAMALPFEFPALTPDEHELHVARPALVREARRQAMLLADRAALSTDQRVTAARRAAAAKGLDMRSEFRLYDRHVRLERVVEALRQLELIESRVFPQRRAA
jgi:hypothetical protein